MCWKEQRPRLLKMLRGQPQLNGHALVRTRRSLTRPAATPLLFLILPPPGHHAPSLSPSVQSAVELYHLDRAAIHRLNYSTEYTFSTVASQVSGS